MLLKDYENILEGVSNEGFLAKGITKQNFGNGSNLERENDWTYILIIKFLYYDSIIKILLFLLLKAVLREENQEIGIFYTAMIQVKQKVDRRSYRQLKNLTEANGNHS